MILRNRIPFYGKELGGMDAPNGTALPVTPGNDWASNLSTLISQTAPALVQARYMDRVMRMNLEREQKGLPPLNPDNYKPGVKAEAGLDKKTLTVIAGLGVGALALMGLALVKK